MSFQAVAENLDMLLPHFHIEDGTLQITNKYVWLWWYLMLSVWDAHSVHKGERWRVLWNGQKTGGLSLRVKRDERVGVWWLDEVDVSVMAWCQTLCHCQCQPHQPIPQWSATVQCVSKPLCCCHFNQCVGAAVLSHFCPLSNPLLFDEWLWG